MQQYLQTTKVEETSEEELNQAFRKQLIQVAGFKQAEVGKMDLSAIFAGLNSPILRSSACITLLAGAHTGAT
jgi:hypothetical protein